MDNTTNSALSKDTIFGASNHTNINSVFNSALALEEIPAFLRLKKLLQILKI